jgi:hypothetical protein
MPKHPSVCESDLSCWPVGDARGQEGYLGGEILSTQTPCGGPSECVVTCSSLLDVKRARIGRALIWKERAVTRSARHRPRRYSRSARTAYRRSGHLASPSAYLSTSTASADPSEQSTRQSLERPADESDFRLLCGQAKVLHGLRHPGAEHRPEVTPVLGIICQEPPPAVLAWPWFATCLALPRRAFPDVPDFRDLLWLASRHHVTIPFRSWVDVSTGNRIRISRSVGRTARPSRPQWFGAVRPTEPPDTTGISATEAPGSSISA